MDAGNEAIGFDTRTGRVTLEMEWPGKREVFVLLPPTLGKLRQLYEEADRISEALAESNAAAAARLDEAPVVDGREEPDAPTVQLLKVIGAQWVADGGGMECYFSWWRKAFELCEADAKPLPEDDDCPVWLASVSLHVRVLTHWLQFPTLAPGIPARVPGAAQANGA